MIRNDMPLGLVAAFGLCALVGGCGSAASVAGLQDGRLTASERQQIAATAEASGNEQLALSICEKAASAAPADAKAQLHYADLLARTGQVTAARSVLTRSLSRASDPLDIERGLGTLDVLTGRNEQALGELNQVLAARPKDVRALVNKAVALDLLGKHAGAQAVYRQALALTPDDPAIANDLALSYTLQGHIAEARQLLSPYVGQQGLPQRMQVTMRLLFPAAAADSESASADPDMKRLQIALGTVGTGR